MTIAQALKAKNKKVASIAKIWGRIHAYNSTVVGSEKPYDLDALWIEYTTAVHELIDLKTKIHAASAPVRREIFALSELKSRVQSLRSLNTQSGIVRERFGSEPHEIKAHFDTLWKDHQIESLESEIDSIQEKLDSFNHSTKL